MPHDFIPSRENELLAWSGNFNAQINAAPGPPPEGFGLTPAQATAYTGLHDAYAAGYANATNPSANSKANIVAKNQAKAALKSYARMLARLVRATPGVTNDQRAILGLTVPDPHLTPVPAPVDPPEVYVLPSLGRIIRIRLRDRAAPTRKGKPPGIAGAAILSAVGDKMPERMADWTFHGNAMRRYFDVNFGSHVPGGARVWITARWFNTRGELGAPSTPDSARIGDGIGRFAIAA